MDFATPEKRAAEFPLHSVLTKIGSSSGLEAEAKMPLSYLKLVYFRHSLWWCTESFMLLYARAKGCKDVTVCQI